MSNKKPSRTVPPEVAFAIVLNSTLIWCVGTAPMLRKIRDEHSKFADTMLYIPVKQEENAPKQTLQIRARDVVGLIIPSNEQQQQTV